MSRKSFTGKVNVAHSEDIVMPLAIELVDRSFLSQFWLWMHAAEEVNLEKRNDLIQKIHLNDNMTVEINNRKFSFQQYLSILEARHSNSDLKVRISFHSD